MSVRRTRPLAPPAETAAFFLKRSESEIALLDRVRPLNWSAEQARLTRAFEQGDTPPPAFEHAPRAALGGLRRKLTSLAATLEAGAVEEQLLAGRARELELEAALVEHVAEPDFARLAAQRFPSPDAPAAVEQSARELLATSPEAAPPDAEALHVTDDLEDPLSLASQVAARLRRGLGEVRVLPVAGLVSLAAVADGVVRVRAGAKLSANVGRRIALHEVEGHVRPRVRGQELGGVFVAGAERGSEDEEGRAIWLEERAGLLGPARRRELGRRYLAAESVRQGAAFWETVRLVEELGATPAEAVELASRVHRGGGLGRESIYLTGFRRVNAAFQATPELERVMQGGRVALEAASALLAGGIELDDDGDVI